MDKTLIDAVKLMAEGREEGFNRVYSETYNHVYFRAKSYMKNEEDALDLVQIVYVEAYKNISSLQEPKALFGWLDGITYRQGMKQYRKKKDVLLTEEGEGIFETLETEDVSSMPELSAEQKETSRIVRELIEELPVLQKIAMIAYYFDNMSVKEIAEVQECSEGTVKSRLNYGRKYLKDRVEEKEKKEGYKLHVFTLPVLYLAIRMLSEETTMTVQAAQGVYNAACAATGLKAGTLFVTSGMTTATASKTSVVAASKVGEAVSMGVKTAGLSMGMKAAIVAGVLAVGGLTVGGVILGTSNKPTMEVVSSETKEEEPIIITLSEDEKIQIVDAIAYFGCMPMEPDSQTYVATARAYIETMLKGDGNAALPCGWTSAVVTKETIKAFYEDGFGISIPKDYAYKDGDITCDSELIWDVSLDYFKYENLEITENGDGTYKLEGTFFWGAEGEETRYSFTATATESGNSSVFGGLKLTNYTINE